jgi:hypothetical protein
MATTRKCLFLWQEYKDKGHNPKNLSWVPVLVKMVSAAQELSTTEERC